ncbi:MAG: S26 family signal peptidase [Pirellulaceae bacterium]
MADVPNSRKRIAFVVVALGCIVIWMTATWWHRSHLTVAPSIFRIEGDSMSPALMGLHSQICCPNCQFTLNVSTSPPAKAMAVCVNCSHLFPYPQHATVVHGDVVQLTPWEPNGKRWDLVALTVPSEPTKPIVKRLVGFPNESIAIKNGELYVNGRLQSKSKEQFDAVKTLVHDATYIGRVEPCRWRTNGGWSWNASASLWTHDAPKPAANMPKSASPDDWSWLEYQHSQDFLGPRAPAPLPIMDVNSLDQWDSRALHAVDDILVEVVFAIPTDRHNNAKLSSGWIVQLHRAAVTAELEVHAENQKMELRINGRKEREWTAGPTIRKLELGLVDRRILLFVNDQEMAAVACPARVESQESTSWSTPVRIGGRGGKLDVTTLRLWRDAYWLPGEEHRPARHLRHNVLGADQYFVLGDNAARSRDSRWFGPVPKSNILGGIQDVKPGKFEWKHQSLRQRNQ